MAQLQGTGDAEQVETLLQYLETNQKGFYGAQTLWDQVSDAGKQVCVQGSGAIEKHVDLRICRRFKGQGMRWTRAGANRLLKLLLIRWRSLNRCISIKQMLNRNRTSSRVQL